MNRFAALVAVSAIAFGVSGCKTLEALFFVPDRQNSGVTEKQRVVLTYLTAVATSGKAETTSAAATTSGSGEALGSEANGKSGPLLPKAVQDLCAGPDVQTLADPITVTVAVAAAQVAFDALVGAIDSRLERLKEAAVRAYDAALVTDLYLEAAASAECVVVERFVTKGQNEERAMVLVNYLNRYTSEKVEGLVGLMWTPIYLHVALAAAQTEKLESEPPKIDLTEALAIGAIQANASKTGQTVELVSTSVFTFTGIEIGTPYVNDVVTGATLSDDQKKMAIANGPLFVPLRSAPTVGTVSVAITERGAAADMDEVGTAEKSIRQAVRSAMGKALEIRLGE